MSHTRSESDRKRTEVSHKRLESHGEGADVSHNS
jgi:hypothetical protein